MNFTPLFSSLKTFVNEQPSYEVHFPVKGKIINIFDHILFDKIIEKYMIELRIEGYD